MVVPLCFDQDGKGMTTLVEGARKGTRSVSKFFFDHCNSSVAVAFRLIQRQALVVREGGHGFV